MDLGALLKSFIYLIASSLLYPVLFMLAALTVWVLIYGGAFFAEWLERIKLPKYKPEEVPRAIMETDGIGVFPHRVNTYIESLRRVLADRHMSAQVIIENILQETSLGLWKSLDRARMVIRIGPSLGLIGTLIPMGTGLGALSQGDMTKLSTDLVIAFTTTVVGLAVGITAYFFYTIKRRWVEEDIKNIELATEILAGDVELEPAA
jgi:biopolymer transport protein ExbB/TolQ